jgi:hypothetical protein
MRKKICFRYILYKRVKINHNDSIQMFQVREEDRFHKSGEEIRLPLLRKQDFLQAEKQNKENQG